LPSAHSKTYVQITLYRTQRLRMLSRDRCSCTVRWFDDQTNELWTNRSECYSTQRVVSARSRTMLEAGPADLQKFCAFCFTSAAMTGSAKLLQI